MSLSKSKDPVEWDELRLFLAVARAEGLTGGARLTGVSPPTLGRRMTALEERLKRQLFDRRQTGYSLTDSGRELYQQALDMEAAAVGIERWRDRNARRIVRISAGSWTSRFLAHHIAELWKPTEPIGIELSTAHVRVDIGHRHADIGVRNRAPDDPRLAGRRMVDVAHAVYRRRGVVAGDLPWIGVIGDAAITPSARWLAGNHGDRTMITCSDARIVVDLMLSGAGRGVVPCFVGDSEPELERDGEPVPELHAEQWLAINEHARREPPVRTVIDRLVALLEANRALFAGERPRPA